jgi:hypothetical protein
MADKKISALTGATTPLAGTEVLPIVQSGATVKVAVSDLTAGRAISATQITLTAGNVIPANGYGIDFSATSHPAGMTSELLNDYEEGTWTPGQGAGLTVVGTFSSSGRYTKVGRIVTLYGSMSATTSIVVGTSNTFCTGLPFATSDLSYGVIANNAAFSQANNQVAWRTSVYCVNAMSATTMLEFSFTYSV